MLLRRSFNPHKKKNGQNPWCGLGRESPTRMKNQSFYLRFVELQSVCSNVLTSFEKQLMDHPVGSWPGPRIFFKMLLLVYKQTQTMHMVMHTKTVCMHTAHAFLVPRGYTNAQFSL